MSKEFVFKGRKYRWTPRVLASNILLLIMKMSIVAFYGYVMAAVCLALVGKYM